MEIIDEPFSQNESELYAQLVQKMNLIWLIKKGGATLLGSEDLSLELAEWEEAFTDNV